MLLAATLITVALSTMALMQLHQINMNNDSDIDSDADNDSRNKVSSIPILDLAIIWKCENRVRKSQVNKKGREK